MTFTSTAHAWTAPGGEAFSYSQWSADQDTPRALLLAVHGLSGAALDYEPLGRHLAAHGVTTIALELRGQGSDPVAHRRGDLAGLEDWYADLHVLIGLLRGQYPGLPFFYYGESMGAALLTRFLAHAPPGDQPAGLILASPVVALPRLPTRFQMILFAFFLWLRPTFRIDVRKFAKPRGNEPPPHVTRDEAHRRWFETAPHRLDRYTIRFFRALHDLMAGCFDAAPSLRVPILVIYAAHDVFIQPVRVEEFFGLLGARDKKITLFPESYHLLLHDHDRALVLNRIDQWLLPRLSVNRTAPVQSTA